jgi:phosphoribosylformylglycinamidine cyclo-ligase
VDGERGESFRLPASCSRPAGYHRAVKTSDVETPDNAYDRAGVRTASGEEALARSAASVRATYTPQVLAGLGAFGGLYDASALTGMAAPVLVASSDGVGTKTLLAAQLGRLDGLGHDLVNHCVNDILVQGAEPLFFLDYVAAARLEPAHIAAVIGSVAAACRAVGIPLLGGETAEMPGVYLEEALELAGTIVGVAERADLVTGEDIRAGDRVVALASGGLQTNGFSLVRRVLAGRYLEPFGDGVLGEALLTPHRSYLGSVRAVRERLKVCGMAHVTGGGIPGNLPRVLPPGLGADISLGSWPVPPVFPLIQEAGGISVREMHHVFNMGAGFLLIVRPEDAGALAEACPEPVHDIGVITEGEGVRLL